MAADRLPDPDGWVKLPCNCYAEWTGDEWRIAASSFTCDHKQGDHCDGAPPVSAAVSPAEPPERSEWQHIFVGATVIEAFPTLTVRTWDGAVYEFSAEHDDYGNIGIAAVKS